MMSSQQSVCITLCRNDWLQHYKG